MIYGNNATIKSANNAAAVAYIMPSVTPYQEYNAGFRYYLVDPDTFSIIDSITYYANVSNTNAWTAAGDVYCRATSTKANTYCSIEAIKAEIMAAANLCERHGWHVQMFVNAATLQALAPFVAGLPVHTVFDHFGLIAPGTQNGALTALRKLLEGGKTWVKISGAYRIAADPNDAHIGPLARALCEANSERIVWGSDWPHTPKHDLRGGDPDQELPFQNIDPRDLLNLVPRWLEDDALVKRVLVDNPRRLYDF